MSSIDLPRAEPIREERREAIERLAERDDAIGDLARSILQSDNEVST